MTLYVDGKPLGEPQKTFKSLETFLQIYRDSFEKNAEALKSALHKNVSPADAVLYVNQREVAVLRPDSKISKVGTDMATTCHMVVLRCPVTKVTALGHFDGAATSQGVNDLVDGVVKEVIKTERSPQDGVDLDLFVIGGFHDDRKLSEALSMELLEDFYSYESKNGFPTVKIHLRTFCAATLNNIKMNYCDGASRSRLIDAPAIFGIIVDVQTGDICRATFQENAKLPIPDLRSSRSLQGVQSMATIYRSEDNCFIMQPFTYQPFQYIEEYLKLSDHGIRKHLSTSPEVEPKNFPDHIRQTLKFIQATPDPIETVFKENEVLKPLIFDPVLTQNGLIWKKRS